MSAAPYHSVPAQEPQLAPVPAPAPPHERKSRKWLLIIGLLIVTVAGAVWWASRRDAPAATGAPAATAFRTVTATAGDLNRVIRVSGQTAAIDFANLTAPMLRGPDAGREMILMHVAAPGTWVKKGTLIAQIDAQSLKDHIDDLGDTIQSAQADIRKRQAEHTIEMENLQQSLRIAKADAEKVRLDYNASETQTDIQRQLLKLSLDEADAKYKQLQADVSQKQSSQVAEVKILEYTLLRHTRHRDRHANDLKAFTIYAPMDGLVVMQQIWRGSEMGMVQQGDRLFPGQPFMKVVDTSKMRVEANINQAESSEFRIGQQVRVKLDAFPGVEFDGKVHSIGALAAGGFRNSYFVRNVPLRITIEGSDPKLIPDLSASGDVVVQAAANQTIVPLSAITSDSGKLVAHVKAANGFERREVTMGLSNDTHAAIAAGLQPGDVVRLN